RAPVLETGKAWIDEGAHRDRHVHDRPASNRRAAEILWRDPDDVEWLAVHDDVPADHGGVRTETRLPDRVIEHGQVVRANRFVIRRPQQPAEVGLQPQRAEVGAGYHHRVTTQRLAVVGDVG